MWSKTDQKPIIIKACLIFEVSFTEVGNPMEFRSREDSFTARIDQFGPSLPGLFYITITNLIPNKLNLSISSQILI
jgi:hypothetical protein